jgi:hypothetical protein
MFLLPFVLEVLMSSFLGAVSARPKRLLLTAALTASALLGQSAAAAVVVSPFFGWNQSQASQVGVNPVDAFATGATGNNNIPADGTANVFTITFDDGLASGTATFAVTDDNIANSDIRQFANSIVGPGATDESVTVTLTGVNNLVANQLDLLNVQITSDSSPASYTATLPSGITTTDSTTPSVWTVGDSLVISHLGNDSDSFNIQGFTVSATPVPEPASAALIGCGVVLMLRRRRG